MYKKICKMVQEAFLHLLDMAVYNAFVIYKMQNNTSYYLSDFRFEIIRGIVTMYGSQRPTIIGRPSMRDSLLRLTAPHLPSLIPQTLLSKQSQRKCVVCESYDIPRDTRYLCLECDAPLYIIDCFKDYHTKLSYK